MGGAGAGAPRSVSEGAFGNRMGSHLARSGQSCVYGDSRKERQ
jgi:hypothetical protein